MLPPAESPWTKTSIATLYSVFRTDDLGARALALYQTSLQTRNYSIYG
jgi:hypothetical protein